MSQTICSKPEFNSVTQVVESNNSLALYSCRAGYRLQSGQLERVCDLNGTWSGTVPVCSVDSILPKAYLVVLIVGATIAVFLACIPYDFYRFRKRKKKVRDHQERLSLVTRIAPGHAKVILETVSSSPSAIAYPQARRFGFKSLFSVFRFVGGKMRSGPDSLDATNPVCGDEENIGDFEAAAATSSGLTSPKTADDSEATTSTCVLSPKPATTPPGPSSADVINMATLAADHRFDSSSSSSHLIGEASPLTEESSTLPGSGSPLMLDNTGGAGSEASLTPAKKAFLMFKKANEIFSRDLDSRRQVAMITSGSSDNPQTSAASSDDPGSEPATVEVTSMNPTVRSGADEPHDSPPDDASTSMFGSPASSTSSPEVALLRKSCPKMEAARTFHYPNGKNSVAYHSMPTISDIP